MISEIVISFATLYFTFIIILILSFITGLVLTIIENKKRNNISKIKENQNNKKSNKLESVDIEML